MRRPILIATIGFITGIIWGLYFNIVPFLLILIIIYLCLYVIRFKINYNSNIAYAKDQFSIRLKRVKKYVLPLLLRNTIRIIKIFFTRKALILFTFSFLVANFYIRYLERDYDRIYNSLQNVKCIGTVISQREEKDYNYLYKIKIEKINGKKVNNKVFYLSTKKNTEVNVKYAEKISFKGEYIKPEIQRNYKGFDYSIYLKSQGIYGTIKVDSDIKVIKGNNLSFISLLSNKIKNRAIENTNRLFTEKTRGIFLGILIGYDELITEDIKDNFSKSSLSHLLAVSGTHVTYIVIGITLILKNLKIPKEKGKILTCILLVFYLYIINFTPSVTRAVIMSIIAIMQIVLHKKQDIATTISISSLLILIFNPYKILNIGFILSYAGTIGIIVFVKQFKEFQENNMLQSTTDCDNSVACISKKANNCNNITKIVNMLRGMCYATISAWILIFPIIMYYFNTFSLTFMISNLIAGVIIGPITIIGLIVIFVSFVNIRVSYVIGKLYNNLLIVLLKSTEIIAKIPISNIYVKTPHIYMIIIYYLIIIIVVIVLKVRKSDRKYLSKKVNLLISNLKNKIKNNIVRILIYVLLISIIIFIYNKIPQNLKINFVDVGQGDCTLITTPLNKRILIDSGGSETYDVGKNILLPYLLDRGVTKIDYIIISHFDTDHCKGFEFVIENLKVRNVIISRQPESSTNYKEFLKIAQKRKINIIYANKGDKLKIEKNLYIYVLWPDSKNFVTENPLNNNSLVCKLVYKKFSCIFTGDIEKNAEEQILKQYEDSNILKSTILKVAHHGSKTSSLEEMLNKINPKIALIGVGTNNKFGHPNNEVIERLKYFGAKIYRTDKMGEITIIVNQKGKLKINKLIKQ